MVFFVKRIWLHWISSRIAAWLFERDGMMAVEKPSSAITKTNRIAQMTYIFKPPLC